MGRRGHGEGALFYEEDRDRWVALLELPPDGSGRRRRRKVTGRTKTEARRKLRQLQRRLEDGLPTGDGSMTLGDFLERWLADVLPARSQVQAKSTVTNYRWAVGHAIRGLGRRRLGELTPENVEALLRHLADQGMARNSVMRVRSVLVMALKHAQRPDIVARNVAELSEMPTSARDPRSGRSLTPEQARQLLDVAAHDRLVGLITVGLMLGLRPGELCGLRWEDVDLDAGVLSVNQSRKRTTDNNGREALVLGAPKTRKSRRALVLPRPVVEALRQHERRQRDERQNAGERWQDLDLVFPTSVGTPMSPSNLRRDLARITVAAGLGRWSPNELRHSAASLLSASGVPLEQIADVLGHTDTRMLLKHYRHPISRTIDAAAAPMERLFGEQGGER
ncbi:MAG TPA: site-specific integrase [Acidimicrobiaceae bacterium]|nr:site-specific integrase [Acidimicrobiaceae bacterium]